MNASTYAGCFVTENGQSVSWEQHLAEISMETRRVVYEGFGTAIEVKSTVTGTWVHSRWIDGPAAR